MKSQTPQSGEPIDRELEQDLIVRVRAGERDAMRDLIDLYKDRLYSFVWRMLRNHHDTEELCQDAFLKAFSSLDSYSSEYRFSTWLYTIAYRLTLNFLRRKRALSGDVDFTGFASDTPDSATLVAESEEAKRVRDLVWSAVDQLSEAQKAAVLLFYRHEQGCQEIAQVLQIPVATVKSHLHRARAKLRDLLEPLVAEESSRNRILSELAG